MACQDYKPLLSRYLDGELPEDQSGLVKDHLPACESCRKTLRLLRMEDHAIRSALLEMPGKKGKSAPPRGLIRAAVIAFVLLGLALVVLDRLYDSMGKKLPTGPTAATSVQAALDAPILIRAKRMGIGDFLDSLSEQAGVPVVRDPKASRPPPSPYVDLVLVQPIRLRSVLALLGDLYGFEHREEGGKILVQ
jgi:hypothetical protein